MSYWHAILLAIVEGLTEFLPVSSTGHMIITSSMLGISEAPFTKLFTVNIQFGTILSVVVLYWRRFLQSFDFYLKLFVAFIPAAVAGFLLGDAIDAMLENVVVVALALLLGGIVLIFIDRLFTGEGEDGTHIKYPTAFQIGLFQCIALIPGVSRSAATIIGGMAKGLSRKAAAEFSFLLAVPTMFAAASYKFVTELLKLKISDIVKMDTEKISSSFASLQSEDLYVLLVGNLVGFIVAIFAIKFFIAFLNRYGFKVFGYYRIALGLLLLGLLAMGTELKI